MTVNPDIRHDGIITNDAMEYDHDKENHANPNNFGNDDQNMVRSKLKMKKKCKATKNIDAEKISKVGALPLLENTLMFKEGRNVNASVYYLRQGILDHHGAGMDPEERQEWYIKINNINLEKGDMIRDIQAIEREMDILRCQPLNRDLNANLRSFESSIDSLYRQVKEADQYKLNKIKIEKLKRCIEHISLAWRKRKMLCIDFLHLLEDNTDGAMCAKQCFNGCSTAPIVLETDEGAIRDAKLFHQKKKQRMSCNSMEMSSTAQNEIIGVTLNSHGTSERVMLL